MGDQKAGDAEAQPEDGRQETGVREPLMDDSQLEILTSHHRLEEGHPEYVSIMVLSIVMSHRSDM